MTDRNSNGEDHYSTDGQNLESGYGGLDVKRGSSVDAERLLREDMGLGVGREGLEFARFGEDGLLYRGDVGDGEVCYRLLFIVR